MWDIIGRFNDQPRRAAALQRCGWSPRWELSAVNEGSRALGIETSVVRRNSHL